MLDFSPTDCAGVDEAGRGCLAFDVVAAAVIMPPLEHITDKDDLAVLASIKDSKKMTAKARERAAAFIKRVALAQAVGTASPAEIDRLNILQATYLAMHRALDAAYAQRPFDKLLVDGHQFKPYKPPPRHAAPDAPLFVRHECVVGGDNKWLNIAAASILAKTHRDALVQAACESDPELHKYGFAKNMAYGTQQHMEALRQHGPTPHHRKSFAPVAAAAAAATAARSTIVIQ